MLREDFRHQILEIAALHFWKVPLSKTRNPVSLTGHFVPCDRLYLATQGYLRRADNLARASHSIRGFESL